MVTLQAARYGEVIQALKGVAINCLFARSVAERHVDGVIYADDADHPSSFYILHPYGMSLLLGRTDNPRFNDWFVSYALDADGRLKAPEWMQAYPAVWHAALADLLGEKLVRHDPARSRLDGLVEESSRVNFSFNEERYRSLRGTMAPGNDGVVRTSSSMFSEVRGSVVPLRFWRDARQFEAEGVGFSYVHEGKIASTAYSSFLHDDYLELGIETRPEHRGKGFALKVCAALIDYCLERAYTPVWSCRLENTASYRLALNLGFEVKEIFPYYGLAL